MTQSVNWGQMISTDTGTGDLALTSHPVAKYRDFDDAVGTGSENSFDYHIIDPVTGDREAGEGYMDGAGNLVRDTIDESTNSDSPVDFADNTKLVYGDLTAQTLNGLLTHDHAGETINPQSIGGNFIFAGTQDGADHEARMVNALSEADEGDIIVPESENYNDFYDFQSITLLGGFEGNLDSSESPSGTRFSSCSIEGCTIINVAVGAFEVLSKNKIFGVTPYGNNNTWTVSGNRNFIQVSDGHINGTGAPTIDFSSADPDGAENNVLIADPEINLTGKVSDNTIINSTTGDALKFRGRDIQDTAPEDGEVYVWNDSEDRWEPSTVDSGDLTYVTTADETADLPNSDQHPNLTGSDLHVPKFAGASRMTMSASQSIPSGSVTKLNFDEVDLDQASGVTADTTNNEFDIDETGIYFVIVAVVFADDANWSTGDRCFADINENGPIRRQDYPKTSTGEASRAVFGAVSLSSGENVDARVYQDSGSSQTVWDHFDNSEAQPVSSWFEIFRVG